MLNNYSEKNFKVIIAGGREFNDYELLRKTMDHLLADKVAQGYRIVIINGDCRGADKLGTKYGEERGYEVRRYPADWSLGRRAGPLRNLKMGEETDVAVCFHDGKSRGTKSMIDIMKNLKKDYRVIHY